MSANVVGIRLKIIIVTDNGVKPEKFRPVQVQSSYRLSVQGTQRVTPAGRYEIRVVELRAATGRDRQLQEARKQRMMKGYYGGLKQGEGRGEALRRVKLEMIGRASLTPTSRARSISWKRPRRLALARLSAPARPVPLAAR